MLYSSIDFENIIIDNDRVASLKSNLGIAKNDTVWLMSGTTDARKGFDFLPEIAEKINDPTHHFIWLGKKIDSGFTFYVEARCQQSKATKVHLLGDQKEDYYNYLTLADAFLLLSREDPFPLVMLEAAALGKPIFAFDSGGVREFLHDGMGAITQNFDTDSFTNTLLRWKNGELKTSKECLKNRAKDFDIQQLVQQWEDLIENL